MAISIKDPAADRAAREVAALAGETMTEAIRRALEERLERLRAKAGASVRAVEVAELIDRGRRRPMLDPRSPEEILGYGPDGTPL